MLTRICCRRVTILFEKVKSFNVTDMCIYSSSSRASAEDLTNKTAYLVRSAGLVQEVCRHVFTLMPQQQHQLH